MVGEGADFRPVYHPAGLDSELRVVLEEVRAGRWRAMAELLAVTGTDWERRTARSQALATTAARSHVIREWLTEAPGSADARMMRTRVMTERALHAHREKHDKAWALGSEARNEALVTAGTAPGDPVPWVCLLALAQIDVGQVLEEHRRPPPEQMLPSGPWRLLEQLHRRDPLNREGHLRALQFFVHARRGGSAAALQFGRWVSTWAPEESGSALLVLPMYGYVEHFRHRRQTGRYDALSQLQWTREPVVPDALRAYNGWFARSEPQTRSVQDLNYLAHALWAGRAHEQAARVFTAMGPYAARQPWGYVSSDPEDPAAAQEEFLRARTQCLAVSPDGGPGGGPPRTPPGGPRHGARDGPRRAPRR